MKENENTSRCDRCGDKRDEYYMCGHIKLCKPCRRKLIRLAEVWVSGKMNAYLKDIGLWQLFCYTDDTDYYDNRRDGVVKRD